MLTATICILTVLSSLWGWYGGALPQGAFIPWAVKHRGEWYRFLSGGFFHADWLHLLINMFVLWSFGSFVEGAFRTLLGNLWGELAFAGLYFSALAASSLSTYFKHNNNPHYISVGASGAVSAVVFSSVLLAPWETVLVFFIPMPAIVMGVLYLLYSWWMARRAADRINHEAHLWGAVWGLVFTATVLFEYLPALLTRLISGP